MKTAFLILAHHQPYHLARLVDKLSFPGVYFFIHIDAKVDDAPFRHLIMEDEKVFFLRDSHRQRVQWCGFSQTKAILKLIQAAVHSDINFYRYCLLSGSDYPIKNNSMIAEKFCSDKEFISIDNKVDYSKDDFHSNCVKHFHLHDISAFNPRNCSNGQFLQLIESITKRIPRKPYAKMPLYQGSTWWALTDKCIHYILSFLAENRDYIKFYKYTRVPDEFFFHSIVKNSYFAATISHDFENFDSTKSFSENNTRACHYIDWNAKGVSLPKVLDISDLDSLLNSSALFARKFDEHRSRALINKLNKLNTFG